MRRKSFFDIAMDQLDAGGQNSAVDWLWHGLVARGNLTLLTSLWKSGKTTLVTGLLQQLAQGGELIGRNCAAGRALVVSEESQSLWAERLRLMPVGPHARLMARPFLTRPTPEAWCELIEHAQERCANGELDLLVVDTLAGFLPGQSDSDAGTLLRFLQPLQRLAETGAAVLILHHPRKKRAEEGSAARGSGALLGFVDVILEMHRFGKLKSDECRRRLAALSRHTETPSVLSYEWNRDTGDFRGLDDPDTASFRDNWETLRAALARRRVAGTLEQILSDWPNDRGQPTRSTMQRWLYCAYDEKRIRREGQGRKLDPFRYRLPNEDDEYWDRGELPPLRPLPR